MSRDQDHSIKFAGVRLARQHYRTGKDLVKFSESKLSLGSYMWYKWEYQQLMRRMQPGPHDFV